jgi:hypothetical protein
MGRIGLPGNRHQPTLNQTIRLFLGVALGMNSAPSLEMATAGARSPRGLRCIHHDLWAPSRSGILESGSGARPLFWSVFQRCPNLGQAGVRLAVHPTIRDTLAGIARHHGTPARRVCGTTRQRIQERARNTGRRRPLPIQLRLEQR